uniref:Cytochrome P450 n=1 Tax=Strigamia maritima TaxID=126957 RepID=T1J9R3_STRMM
MLEAERPNNDTKENPTAGSKKTLTREILVAQTIIFLLAGHETTANTINFMVYELARDQDIQDKLIKEVDEVMTESKGKLSYEGVTSMRYLDMVISETLRKYPPLVRIDRVCSEEKYNLNGITIRKGMALTIPVHAMHNNQDFFPNPNIFDPERFSPENKTKRNPFTYLPFGEGPRNCIAKRFALLETKLVVVHMLYNYRFKTCKETDVYYPLQMYNGSPFLQPISICDDPIFREITKALTNNYLYKTKARNNMLSNRNIIVSGTLSVIPGWSEVVLTGLGWKIDPTNG